MSIPLYTNRIRARHRGAGEIHLGVGADASRIVGPLLDQEAHALVDLGPLTAGQWATALASIGNSPRWQRVAAAVLDAVAGHDRRPLRHTITVDGRGPVAAVLRTLLVSMGATITDHADDLAVVVAPEAVTGQHLRPWHRRGIPTLPVTVTADRVEAGPLLAPGHGPCPACLDFCRADIDAAWPMLAAQLALPPVCPTEVSPSADLVAAAATLVALILRAEQTGRPLPIGVSLSITSPHATIDHHLWSRHPRCDCGRTGAAIRPAAG